MIISRWKGFEIDSSEGYYAFTHKTANAEEAWRYLHKILDSPLLWKKVAFDLTGKDKLTGHILFSHLHDLAKKGILEDTENKYEYCPHRHAMSLDQFKSLILRVQENLKAIGLTFCIRPLNDLDADENAKLKTWFLGQFSDRKKGRTRWQDYSALKEEELTLGGNSDMTDSFMPSFAFEASLNLDLEGPGDLTIGLSAGDPTLVVYLISTLFPGYDLEYCGDHYISCDRRPDKLKATLEEKEEDDE